MGIAKRVNPKLLNIAESMERSASPTQGRVIDFTDATNRGQDPGLHDIPENEWPELLSQHFPFYSLLNPPEQREFLQATHLVYSTKHFVFQFGFTDDKSLARLLISASTARFLLKRSADLLQEFNTFVIYPGMFVHAGQAGALGMATYWDRKATRSQALDLFQVVKSAAKQSASSLNFIFEELQSGAQTPGQKAKVSTVAAAALHLKAPYPAPDASDAALLAAIPAYLDFDRALLAAFREGETALGGKVPEGLRELIAGQFHKPPSEVTSEELADWFRSIVVALEQRVKIWEHATAVLKSPPKVSSVVHLPYQAFRASIDVPSGMPDVCAHELAHCIDLLDGRLDGMTPDAAELPPDWPARWARFLNEESKDFAAHYLGESELNLQKAEYFAEACAAYFRFPDKMKAQDPHLYQLMAEFFRYDPPQVDSRWWNYVKTSFGLSA